MLNFLFLFFLEQNFVIASDASEVATKKKWTHFLPYVPEKNEYQVEVGRMWEANNLYWLGLTYGRHIGACKLIESQRCQQYLDFTVGVGGRESYNEGLFLAGPRWQYVNFPNPYAPSFGVFGGVMNVRDDNRDRQVGVYGLGFGYTVTLHEKLNVKWENRIGNADQFWVQSMLSLSLKIDEYVDGFAHKVKKVGKATVETTGSILRSTIEAPKNFVDWFNDSTSSKEEPSVSE